MLGITQYQTEGVDERIVSIVCGEITTHVFLYLDALKNGTESIEEIRISANQALTSLAKLADSIIGQYHGEDFVPEGLHPVIDIYRAANEAAIWSPERGTIEFPR